MIHYRERAIGFGDPERLVGITCTPSETTSDDPWVLILNAGVVHRVGPSRAHVDLARALAERGVPSLRFDQAGLGDSDPRREAISIDEGPQRDIQRAIAWLATERQARRFALFGLCSGAREAFLAGLRDERIESLFLVDGVAYRTPRFFTVHYGERLFEAQSWKNALSGRNRYLAGFGAQLRERLAADPEDDSGGAVYPEWPERSRIEAGLLTIADRGGRVLFYYTGGARDEYNYAEQFRDFFPRAAAHPRVAWHFDPEGDHALGRPAPRRRLIEAACDWLTEPARTGGAYGIAAGK